MGIEPTSEAWEAYDITQKHAGLAAFLQFSERLNWKIMENGKRLSSLMNPQALNRRRSSASGTLPEPSGNYFAARCPPLWARYSRCYSSFAYSALASFRMGMPR
jgi:hypothetical protein